MSLLQGPGFDARVFYRTIDICTKGKADNKPHFLKFILENRGIYELIFTKLQILYTRRGTWIHRLITHVVTIKHR